MRRGRWETTEFQFVVKSCEGSFRLVAETKSPRRLLPGIFEFPRQDLHTENQSVLSGN